MIPTVPISKFKTRCLALLEEVQKTGRPLRVTRFGKPVADIVPATLSAPPSWLGLMAEQGELLGDVITPVASEHEWEALREEHVERPRSRRRRRT